MPRYKVFLGYRQSNQKPLATVVAATYEEARQRVAASRGLDSVELSVNEVRTAMKCDVCGWTFQGFRYNTPFRVYCTVCKAKNRLEARLRDVARARAALDRARAKRTAEAARRSEGEQDRCDFEGGSVRAALDSRGRPVTDYERGWLFGLRAGRSQIIGWLEQDWPDHKPMAIALALKAARHPTIPPEPTMQVCPGCQALFPLGGVHSCPTHRFGTETP